MIVPPPQRCRRKLLPGRVVMDQFLIAQLTTATIVWWVIIGLLIASRTYPWAGWLILPLLLAFGALQMLRYLIPPQEQK